MSIQPDKWLLAHDEMLQALLDYEGADTKNIDYANDISACFRWLVPLFEPLGYDFELSNDAELLGWRVSLHNRNSECSIASPYRDIDNPTPEQIATAICDLAEHISKGEEQNDKSGVNSTRAPTTEQEDLVSTQSDKWVLTHGEMLQAILDCEEEDILVLLVPRQLDLSDKIIAEAQNQATIRGIIGQFDKLFKLAEDSLRLAGEGDHTNGVEHMGTDEGRVRAGEMLNRLERELNQFTLQWETLKGEN